MHFLDLLGVVWTSSPFQAQVVGSRGLSLSLSLSLIVIDCHCLESAAACKLELCYSTEVADHSPPYRFGIAAPSSRITICRITIGRTGPSCTLSFLRSTAFSRFRFAVIHRLQARRRSSFLFRLRVPTVNILPIPRAAPCRFHARMVRTHGGVT